MTTNKPTTIQASRIASVLVIGRPPAYPGAEGDRFCSISQKAAFASSLDHLIGALEDRARQ
jgi:hypothetical protein